MANQWTDGQRRAIERTHGMVCVDAGAGAGKTGVIVERFVRLIVDGKAPADRILAIAFGDKAAQEMKHRIVQALESLGLVEERRRAEYGYIHTIHGLCRRILAENPFEAGIDPAFAIADAREVTKLWSSAFEGCVRAALDTEGPVKHLIAVSPTVPVFGPDRNDLLAPLHTSLYDLIDRSRSDGMSVQEMAQWGAEATIAAEREFLPEIQKLQEEAERAIEEAAKDSGSAQAIAHAHEFIHLRDRLDPFHPMESWLGMARETLDTLNKAATRDKEFATRDAASRLLAQLKPIDLEKERTCARLGAAMLTLGAQVWEEHARLKQEAALVDFEDLQQFTLDLLTGASTARERYRDRFRYLMVDEFQDVNRVQARLIETLGENANLMVVGDERQSIYAFRSADVEQFRAYKRKVQAAALVDQDAAAAIPLNVNFRSRDAILSFVGHTFGRLWPDDGFQRLEAGRSYPPKTEPCVEILLHDSQQQAAEGAFVAEVIREWVDSGMLEVHDRTSSQMRPARYGDIAILLRQFTRISSYEDALRSQGVPYFVVGGGRGYYARSEIRDMKNALQSIARPDDDLALACLLRSPMVGLTLDALVCLAEHAKTVGSLYEAVCAPPPDVPDDDRASIATFLEWYEPLSRYADRQTVSAIVERLVEATSYDAKLLCRRDGAQQLANVRKLIQMTYETPGVRVEEFADRIAPMRRLSQREGEAPTQDEFSNVVRFLTVHGSKGLEFPIVILADICSPSSPRQPRVLADLPNRQLGMTWRDYHPSTYREIEKRQAALNQREEQRLMYVAMTRAKEHLAVAMRLNAKPRSWALNLQSVLRLRPGEADRVVETDDGCRFRVRHADASDRGTA